MIFLSLFSFTAHDVPSPCCCSQRCPRDLGIHVMFVLCSRLSPSSYFFLDVFELLTRTTVRSRRCSKGLCRVLKELDEAQADDNAGQDLDFDCHPEPNGLRAIQRVPRRPRIRSHRSENEPVSARKVTDVGINWKVTMRKSFNSMS